MRLGPRDRRAQRSPVLGGGVRRGSGASVEPGPGLGRRGLLCSPHSPGSEASRTRLGSNNLMGRLPAGN